MPKPSSAVQEPANDAQLRTRWLARVASGQFSAGVHGVGSIRVMGRSGDTPVAYPITSLATIETLAPDEAWAVRQAEAIIRAHQAQGRAITAVLPNQPLGATPVNDFDPQRASYIVLNRIIGG